MIRANGKLDTYCRECNREYQREYQRLRRKVDPEFREARREAVRKYRPKARVRRHKDRKERKEWTLHVLDLLREHGLSYQEIARRTRMDPSGLWVMRKNPKHVPTKATAERLTTLLRDVLDR